VVADIAKLSVGREAYYTRELATDHEQYLSGHGESPGRWYGAGASSIGLEGEASVGGFQAMFEGRDPTTGELLGRPHGRTAVPAFDVVLRPTKSVSILYGLGDPATGRAVLVAHHVGLAEAVAYLDDHLSGPQIARQLFVSVNTLRTHTKRIFTKLDVNTRAAAVSRAADLGLL
jgi:TrwC relaxase/Bacterial regulatory proteins, luxR family